MTWELKNDRPIYAQLIEQIKLRIISGFYRPENACPPFGTWPPKRP